VSPYVLYPGPTDRIDSATMASHTTMTSAVTAPAVILVFSLNV